MKSRWIVVAVLLVAVVGFFAAQGQGEVRASRCLCG